MRQQNKDVGEGWGGGFLCSPIPRTGVDADGKPEDPVQLALDLGLTVLQSTGENQLSPITAPDQVISRSDKDD